MKVDLLKLTRLNRIAVCGRCKHQFDVSVRMSAATDEDELTPTPSPIRFTPSEIPIVETPTQPPDQDTLPPVSGAYQSDDHSPPPFSRPRRASPVSGWPQSDDEPGQRDSGSKWPQSSRPRLGWSRPPGRHAHDTEPSMPRADHDTEPASMPHLELDFPDEATKGGTGRPKRKESLVRQRKKEIVVEVGDRKGKRRRRNTYDPDKLVTQPNLATPRVEGDDEP